METVVSPEVRVEIIGRNSPPRESPQKAGKTGQEQSLSLEVGREEEPAKDRGVVSGAEARGLVDQQRKSFRIQGAPTEPAGGEDVVDRDPRKRRWFAQ